MIPAFNAEGNLPKGIHWASWQEIYERFGWSKRRNELLAGLKLALISLKKAGCTVVYIDGSFVTKKENPEDYDCCWEADGRIDESKLDKVFLKTNSSGRQLQKLKWGGEFFIADVTESISRKTFLNFFQYDRNGEPKGIVAINLEGFQ